MDLNYQLTSIHPLPSLIIIKDIIINEFKNEVHDDCDCEQQSLYVDSIMWDRLSYNAWWLLWEYDTASFRFGHLLKSVHYRLKHRSITGEHSE